VSFLPLVRIFTSLQFFASNKIENHEKHAYIHHVKSGTCHDLCSTGSRIRGAKTKRTIHSRFSCTFLTQYCLLGLFFLRRKNAKFNCLFFYTQVFMELFSVLLHIFCRRKRKGYHMKRRKRGRQNCHRKKRHRCRTMTDICS